MVLLVDFLGYSCSGRSIRQVNEQGCYRYESKGIEKLATSPLYKHGVDFTTLTDKQQLFVNEYMVDFNATAAAKRAGYKQAGITGPKMVATNKKIRRLVGKYRRELINEGQLRKEDVVQQIVFGLKRSAKDFVDEEGKLIQNMNDLPDEVAMTVDAIEQDVNTRYDADGTIVSETVTTKYRMNRKGEYISMAMRHLGMNEAQDVNMRHSIDWDSLVGSDVASRDVIEGEILAIGNE